MSARKEGVVPSKRIKLPLLTGGDYPAHHKFAVEYGEAWGVAPVDKVILTHTHQHPEFSARTWENVKSTAHFMLNGWEYHLEEEDGELFAAPEGALRILDARATYGTDDIIIEPDATVAAVADGWWVDARVWIAREEDET